MRRNLVRLLLVLLTLWPAVQIYLVFAYDMSSWKLAGWGMYASPRAEFVGMDVYLRRRGRTDFEPLRAPSAAVREASGVFLEHFKWLGRLWRPDAFVRVIKAEDRSIEAARVVVSLPVMEPAGGMIVLKETVFEYSAPEWAEL